ncbi:class I SAM-dependent methyltransferase [Mesosutterella sp. AGMB02718]|uniref:Class I SAM-dependent methyltransferase n=1 Tax=Mesosutterella faecium TaxID=2925194 RepID=A0ABT7IN31_9BURK|nr:class I SAM-dependent methyltransferase [Mesosutterella sp. AGMB02718]MDL2059787.1 class I SAM-dependent methyltransferase [Mesosutterella sp. AGMB02718]
MDQSLMARYWTEDSDNYEKVVRAELEGWQSLAWKRLLSELLPASARTALDFGCGPGFFSLLLSELGLEVTGIDCSAGMLEKARRLFRGQKRPAAFIQTDIEAASFPDSAFDVIVSRNVTWTLSRPELVYRKCLEFLKPGGRLLVFDANWNLPLFDPTLAAWCKAREEACVRQYGSTFDGGPLTLSLDLRSLPLSSKVRPAWDLDTLPRLGFARVRALPGLIDRLWSDKEKLLYGETPLFGVIAEKPAD